jgi:hypothetical protein
VILEAVGREPDITLADLRTKLAGHGIGISVAAVAVLRPAEDHDQKKSGHAAEQDRPDVLTRREAWFDGQLDLDPERLVLIDETPAFAGAGSGPRPTWPAAMAAAARASGCGWASRKGHRKTTTLVAGLRTTGMVAPLVFAGPINGE